MSAYVCLPDCTGHQQYCKRCTLGVWSRTRRQSQYIRHLPMSVGVARETRLDFLTPAARARFMRPPQTSWLCGCLWFSAVCIGFLALSRRTWGLWLLLGRCGWLHGWRLVGVYLERGLVGGGHGWVLVVGCGHMAHRGRRQDDGDDGEGGWWGRNGRVWLDCLPWYNYLAFDIIGGFIAF